MPQIEGHVGGGLGNRNNRPSQDMGDARFIHDVWVSERKIHDHNRTAHQQQIEYVLDDDAVLPDIVGAQASQLCALAGKLDSGIDGIELRLKRHHDGNQVGFAGKVGDAEHCWCHDHVVWRRRADGLHKTLGQLLRLIALDQSGFDEDLNQVNGLHGPVGAVLFPFPDVEFPPQFGEL